MPVSYILCMMGSKSKLCFIIPECNRDTPTHFSYLYDFIEKISEEFDIFLIAEKGTGEAPRGVSRFYIQKFSWPILRIIENELAIEWARWLGYKTFYVHYSFLSAYNAAWVARFTGGQVFYWNCGEPWKYKRGILREFFERIIYKLVHFLVTGTEGLKKGYAEHYSLPLGKIKIISNYIDVSSIKYLVPSIGKKEELKSKLNISEKSKVILFVHRLSKRKGAHYLPEILSDLKSESIVLVVIGDGPERKAIEKQIANSEVRGKVRFLGWVPQRYLIDYYSIADVFIMPSDEEGFPHVLLESMAYGVPFVAFDVGGVREIVPTNSLKYVVASGDTRVFTEKIKELMSFSEKETNHLRIAMRDHVLRYDIGAAVNIFQKIIS